VNRVHLERPCRTPSADAFSQRLDGVTKLDISPDEQWYGLLWPDAGEAVVFGAFGRGKSATRHRDVKDGGARARRNVRRYTLAARLNRLVTLTFREAERSTKRARRRLKQCLAECRRVLGVPFPYVAVQEQHPGGHGIHIHLLTTAWVAERLVSVWPHGTIVQAKRLRSKAAMRRAAFYVCEMFDGNREGSHRYEVGQGFAPVRVRVNSPFRSVVWLKLYELMGGSPSLIWSFVPVGWTVWLAWWDPPVAVDENGDQSWLRAS
jgi:hypothetical protein